MQAVGTVWNGPFGMGTTFPTPMSAGFTQTVPVSIQVTDALIATFEKGGERSFPLPKYANATSNEAFLRAWGGAAPACTSCVEDAARASGDAVEAREVETLVEGFEADRLNRIAQHERISAVVVAAASTTQAYLTAMAAAGNPGTVPLHTFRHRVNSNKPKMTRRGDGWLVQDIVIGGYPRESLVLAVDGVWGTGGLLQLGRRSWWGFHELEPQPFSAAITSPSQVVAGKTELSVTVDQVPALLERQAARLGIHL
jgi:hypothetical protein